ncbi:hypothetical protein HK096_010329 [Nowakowskiella sp. JEL0078]|nr:hypothetical protein HK096_010329 [Nowakowskiella sp. JEL0078]
MLFGECSGGEACPIAITGGCADARSCYESLTMSSRNRKPSLGSHRRSRSGLKSAQPAAKHVIRRHDPRDWGFDPWELLERVRFPNDTKENLLRRSKETRMLAIRRQEVIVPEEPILKREIKEQIKDDDGIALKEQLAHSAAAIMIQAAWKGVVVRRKYLAVVHAKLSLLTVSQDSNFDWDYLPEISDLTIQVG